MMSLDWLVYVLGVVAVVFLVAGSLTPLFTTDLKHSA